MKASAQENDFAVFVCTESSANEMWTCPWVANWRLKSPANVLPTDKIPYCSSGTSGPGNLFNCPTARWTAQRE